MAQQFVINANKIAECVCVDKVQNKIQVASLKSKNKTFYKPDKFQVKYLHFY